jgi:hypothetical protein
MNRRIAALPALALAGAIVVSLAAWSPWSADAPSAAVAERLRTECNSPFGDEGEAHRCLGRVLTDEVLSGSVELGAANHALALVAANSPTVLGRVCHSVLHELGSSIADTGAGASDTITVQTYGCFGGVWHGYLERLGEVIGPDGYRLAVVGLCDAFSTQPDVVYFDCLHGAGHGLGMFESVSLADALDACVELMDEAPRTETRDPLRDCATGVVSSYVNRATLTGHGPPVDESLRGRTALDSCRGLDGVFADACYERIAAVWAKELSWSGGEVARECRRHAGFEQLCAYGYGRTFSLPSYSGCEDLGDLAGDCLRGVVDNWVPLALAANLLGDPCLEVSSAWQQECRRHWVDRLRFEVSWDYVLANA